MSHRKEAGDASAPTTPEPTAPPTKPRRTRRSRATPATRPEVSRDAIARLMSLSPDRPHFTVGDVIHRLKRSAPSLPGAPLSPSSRPPR